MSITANIENPADMDEEKFNIPICTEEFYKKFILPIAGKNSLDLLMDWGTMREISSEDMPRFIEQLETYLEKIQPDSLASPDSSAYILERLNFLIAHMNSIFSKRNNATILIG